MTTRYFVTRDPDGSVSHLARVFDSGSALSGESFIDGEWRAHESATDDVLDRSLGDEIDEDEAQRALAVLAARQVQAADRIAEPARATARQEAVMREAFERFFPGGGPQLPVPIPDHGHVADDDWNVRYALNADENGDPRLDFFAESRITEPLFGQVSHEGNVVALESFVDHYSYDPEVDGDKAAAEQAMDEHNAAVQRRLTSRRLA